ncbi:hypothetical protein [Nocardioides jishulii]|uniref:Uncharacterized protein n=1 Tax=Nocardioides jishulii TaxID=2575440 RepID=A0A4U2YQJ6_9ACTN|nr:hypothetical protein [Nocardioides jishulii]QCX26498.1 hypothetical protein FCL41_02255 [Nocardioides jishulii]TKI63696.1 hypothetical protein FC770_00450 [Nocardioides jishulii]
MTTETRRDNQPLDSFESSLLTELQAQVALNEAAAPARKRRGRTVLGVSLGGLVAAGVTALGVSSLTASPAWSVSESNGELTVKVNRLDGAENLERELAKHGVKADIHFLQPGMKCQDDRYTEDTSAKGRQLSIGGEEFQVKLDSGVVGKGQTFVLWASVQQYENGARSSVDFGVADGPVAPCNPSSDSHWDEPIDPDMGAPVAD